MVPTFFLENLNYFIWDGENEKKNKDNRKKGAIWVVKDHMLALPSPNLQRISLMASAMSWISVCRSQQVGSPAPWGYKYHTCPWIDRNLGDSGLLWAEELASSLPFSSRLKGQKSPQLPSGWYTSKGYILAGKGNKFKYAWLIQKSSLKQMIETYC